TSAIGQGTRSRTRARSGRLSGPSSTASAPLGSHQTESGAMSQRDLMTMTDSEIADFLDGARRAQVATINPDGTPHVVPLSYVIIDGRMVLWTDPRSKKIANLRRDPRITCLVEDGAHFAEFR